MPEHELSHAIATSAGSLSAETIAALRSVPIFSSLDECGLHNLDGATERWLDRGEFLLRQGQLSREF